MIKKFIPYILFLLILLLSCAVSYFVFSIKQNSSIACVYQNNNLIKKINLSNVTEAYTFDVKTKDGKTNTILVKPGTISVQSADCPDKICVQQGEISTGLQPIVCLPNNLVIKIEADENLSYIDAMLK